MAPTTRSSAPSTPAKSRASTGSESPATPTRRPPHCTKCGRPRAGHPRSGCPFVVVDAPNQSPISPSATQVAPAAEDGLSEELSSLHIVSPTEESTRRVVPLAGEKLRRKLSVRFAILPEQSLASLSPTDTHLMEQLIQPGMMSNTVTTEDKVAHVLKWRRALDDTDPLIAPKEEPAEANPKAEPSSRNTTPKNLSRTMPCTLMAPTASLTTTEPVSDHYIGGSAISMNDTIYLLPGTDAKKPKPLSRSMSYEERSSFLKQLSISSSTPPATLLSLPLADVDSVQSDAEKLGFHVRLLPSREDHTKWVILGTDEEAVDLLAKKFLEEEKKTKGKDRKLTAVAGGVIFGAVATWTGLAFS